MIRFLLPFLVQYNLEKFLLHVLEYLMTDSMLETSFYYIFHAVPDFGQIEKNVFFILINIKFKGTEEKQHAHWHSLT